MLGALVLLNDQRSTPVYLLFADSQVLTAVAMRSWSVA